MNLSQVKYSPRVSFCSTVLNLLYFQAHWFVFIFVCTFDPDSFRFFWSLRASPLFILFVHSFFRKLPIDGRIFQKRQSPSPGMSLHHRMWLAVRLVQTVVPRSLSESTLAPFKRISKNVCVWLCQQCCSYTNWLLSEVIAMVNASKRSTRFRFRFV